VISRSKALLVAYVQSSSVTSAIGLSGSHIILKYLRTNVFPHEDHFAAHCYNFTRSFGEYSNTCLEGTNNGLKYNSESVLPSMGLAKAGKCMINQDERKASDRKQSSASAFNGIPLYTNTETCRQIQSVAETMICEQQSLADHYASVRISSNQWHVAYSAERKSFCSNSWPRPIFSRVRIATLDNDGGLRCSCGYTERNGVPCRHLMHVAISYGINFKAFSHHQVAVRFWQAYDKFVAVGKPTEMDSHQLGIRNMLWQAGRHQSSCGTSVPNGIRPYQESRVEFMAGKESTEAFRSMNATSAMAYFRTAQIHVRVLNYSATTVNTAVAAMETDTVGGLTQETYNPNNDLDFDFEVNNKESLAVWQAANATTMTAHEVLAPRFKELASLCERKPEKIKEAALLFDNFIQSLKAEQASGTTPVGRVISSLAPSNHHIQHAHTRQKQHR
jgi:hypothetical protein